MGSAFAAPADALDDTIDTSEVSPGEIKRADLARMIPATDTRAVVSDNSPYIKIDANGNGTDNASALGEKSIAIGSNASTRPSSTGLGGAVAVGSVATAKANNVAVGAQASALGDEGAVALGAGANAAGKSSIALGNEAQASGWGAYALGRKAQASAESGLAIGDSTVASQTGAMAIGMAAAASSENAMAIGTNAVARASDSVALGSYSEATRAETVSVGTAGFERQVVNVARGTQATDAVNVAQLQGVTSALGGSAGVAADGSITKPSYRVGDNVYNDVGSALQAASQTGGGDNAVQYDDASKSAVTLGGTGAAVAKLTNVRAGTLAASSTDAVNGSQLFATNNRVTNVEQSLTDSGLIDPGTGESLAVTYDSAQKDRVTLNSGSPAATLTNVKAGRLTATSTDAVNGAQLFTTNKNVSDLQQSLTDGGLLDPVTRESLAVTYDGAQKGTVSLAGTGGTTLGNVKAGKVTASSMEAVNGGQLFGATSSVAGALGGGSTVNADGTISKPAYTVGDKTFNNVGDALQAAASTGGGSADANAVQYDGAGKTSVTLGGTGAAPVSLKNVATGVADTDAVNVKQLATGLSDVKNDIATSLGDGSLDMKYIKVKATGVQANALGKNSVAIGSAANATNTDTLAIGSGARASGNSSIAIGINSVATGANTLSVGSYGAERRIVNVGDGVDDNDAVNMKQLNDALVTAGNQVQAFTSEAMTRAVRMDDMTRDVSSKPGSFVAVEGLGDDGSLPSIASMNGRDPASGTAAAIGVASAAAGVNAIAVGLQSVAQSDNSVAIGSIAQTGIDQPYSVAIGSMVTTNGTRALGVGSEVRANGANSVAVGNNWVSAIGESSVAIGNAAKVLPGSANSIAMGKDANVTQNVSGAIALGANASVTTAGSGGVALGSDSVANRGNALSVGSSKVQRQIVNVSKGTQSTDAVNLSQLKGVTDALGGGSSIAADGSVTAPTYKVGDQVYDNVGDALSAAGQGGGTDPNAVAYDSVQKDKVTLAGENGTTITNVKAGEVSADSKDAVNGSQLHGTAQSVADALGGGSVVDANGQLSAPTYSLADPADGSKQIAYHNVGDALENLDGRVATNTGDITNIKNEFANAGLVDGDGHTRAAVTYDKNADGTPNYGSATLAGQDGTILSNVKAGVADKDAVNVSQLKSSGLIGEDGKSIAAVTYDRNADGTTNLGSVTLAGENGTQLKNVANATDDGDALNLGQLKEAGLVTQVDPNDPNKGVTSLAVTYDDASKAKATLGGADGTTLSNVKAGVADKDAVNVSQLKSSGLIGEDGKSIAAVTYDRNADGTTNLGSVTLAGENGTQLKNVANATDDGDALNLGQLKEAGLVAQVDPNDPNKGVTSLAVTYDDASKAKATLGGTDGTILSNVKAGVADKDAVNVSQLKGSGLIGDDGKSIAAVTYDRKADGATNYGSVTLGGGKSVSPVKLSNVAQGTAGTDAVNVDQLAGAIRDVEGGMNPLSVSYDDVSKTKATLDGAGGTILSNVKAGKADMDAVNVSQLKSSGLVGEDGKSIAAVTYDRNADGTTNLGSATLAGVNGTQLKNVADATDDGDALNLGQLKEAGLVTQVDPNDPNKGVTSLAVTYDNGDKESITLGNAGTPVAIHNVADGVLSATSKDAVNGSQLYATNQDIGDLRDSLKDGGVIDPTTGESLAVTYDDASKAKATLGGADGTILSNVKAGVADKDAVNVSQLKGSGLIGEDGKSIAAVTYDRNADGTTNLGSATLAGVNGTQLKNVANATDDGDALNLGQLKEAGLVAQVDPNDPNKGMTSLAVTYDDASKAKATLGGTDGTILSNVKAGVADKDAVNVSQLKSSGLVGEDGKSIAAVTYDRKADGTTNYGSVTLGGGKSVSPVKLSNVAQGTAGTDAVNVDQLAGAIRDVEGGMNPLSVSYDDASKAKATLGGAGGTTLSNVAAGKADMDAVNVSQLKSSGLVGEDGKSIAAVTYDRNADGTTNLGSATLAGVNGTQLKNVANATDDGDALNLGQLKSTGLVGEDGSGNLTSLGVTYDDATKSDITLGNAGTPVAIHNVADGVLSATSKDAVNGSQLYATNQDIGDLRDSLKDGGVIDPTTGQSLAVTYDDASKAKATLGGTDGTILSNVKAGVADKDAVNVSQLKGSGLIGDDGKSIAAVTYDRKADGTTNYGSVTLGGGKSVSPVKLSNVAQGTAGTDAVNVDQLAGAIRDVEGGMNPLSVSYDDASKAKATLDGAGGTTLSNVAAGKADKDAVNVSQLKSSGLIGEDGKTIAAMTYDRNADGTPNYTSATLAGLGGTTLSNVKAGKADMDAVNVSQLKSSGLIGNDGKALAAVTYDKNADGTPKYTSATLAGEGGTILSNVKAGVAERDAVNVSQLKSTGLIGEDGKTIAAMTYDKNADGTPNYTSATLAGLGGTMLSNVKAGKADMDAVNVSQLKSSGLIGNDGKALAAVTYDKNADGTPKYTSATLAGEGGTILSNVKAGVAERDAVNVSQLKSTGLIGEDGKTIAAVTYDKNADGTPNYTSATLAGPGGTTLSNVKAGKADMDAVNVSQLKSSGLIGEDGKTLAAVTYDKNADGTPNYTSATLAGPGGTMLSNVKAGKADMDAVNVSQLKSSGLIGDDGKELAAVTYDRNADGTPNYGSVTLGGGKSVKPVTLANVATGVIGTDAVNVDQLTGGLNDLEDKLVNGAIDFKYIKVKSEGVAARASGDQTVAIGAASNATAQYAMALGSGARATSKNAVAIGFNSVADQENTVSVGSLGEERRIVNVKSGQIDALSTDAVNGSQLYAALDQINASVVAQEYSLRTLAQTRDVTSKPGSFMAVEGFGADGNLPNVASLNGQDPTSGTAAAIGISSQAAGVNAIAVGLEAVAGSNNAVAIGSFAQTGIDHPYSVAIGSMVTTNGPGAVAIGAKTKANGENSVAVGTNGAAAVGKSSVVVGDNAQALAGSVNSIAIGANANVTRDITNAIALGANAKVLQAGSIALGAGSLADRANALSIGAAGAERQIVNVAKGAQDTDAVNVSQLKGVTAALGGKAGVAADGSITAPSYAIGGQTYNNVEDALKAAAQSGGGASDPNGVIYDGALKDKVTLAGQDGTTLSNVKAGELSATSTDAVTGGQLFATNESLGDLQQSLKDGGVIDPTTGKSLAVTYDGAQKDKVTLAGQGGTTLSNVKAGFADTDAVNVSQLKGSGLIGDDGKSIAAVTYDRSNDGATNFGSVTLGGMGAGIPVALQNVAAGKASMDAVNVSQLTGVTEALGGGAGLDSDGRVTAPSYTVGGKTYTNVNDALKALAESESGGGGTGTDPNAVAYDDTQKDKVTLAGANGTVISNVANGSLAENSTDAINGAQMNALAQDVAAGFGGGASFDPGTGKLTAPTYELADANGGTAAYHNVGDAMKNLDGRVSDNTTRIDSLQQVAANAVQYDDASHGAVTLGGKSATVPVALKNVADGAADTDAVNVRQLRSAGLVGDDGQLQAAVVYDKRSDGTTDYGSVTLGGAGASVPVALHNVAAGKAMTDAVNVSQVKGVTDALGGGATIDPNTGDIVAPNYQVGGNTFSNAGDALTNIDKRVTTIQNGIGESMNLAGAVAYDKLSDGTPNFGKVTLGNGMTSSPVTLTNVADGKSQYDAVNYGQLSALQGQVDDLDGRVGNLTVPGGGSGGSGTTGSNLIAGTGGSGATSGDFVAAKPGTGNGNVAAGSNAKVADGVNNGATFGAGSTVNADSGTAIGHGASVAADATDSVAIGHNSTATEANTVSVGKEGAERRIVNVADGLKATDAVSKGQFDRAMGGMQGQINDVSRNAYSGIAAATALAMIPSIDPGKNMSFGIGAASFKGYQAVSLGGEARITENLKMRAGVGLSSGNNTFGVGASYQW